MHHTLVAKIAAEVTNGNFYNAAQIGQALEQAAQGSGGVTIPGGVQKTCRCGTSGHGLAVMVVLG